MLLKIYLASLAFGGVLLVASLVIGHDGDGDADFDGHPDLDLDVDVDLASEGHAPDHGDIDALGGIFGALKSIRFWTFFSAFFGLTGTVFEGLELMDDEFVVLALALVVGILAGATIVTALRKLRAGEHGHVEGSSDYVGKSGEIRVRTSSESPGTIRMELRGRTIDLMASTEETEPIAPGEQALVIEMRGTTAVVTRLPTASKDD